MSYFIWNLVLTKNRWSKYYYYPLFPKGETEIGRGDLNQSHITGNWQRLDWNPRSLMSAQTLLTTISPLDALQCPPSHSPNPGHHHHLLPLMPFPDSPALLKVVIKLYKLLSPKNDGLTAPWSSKLLTNSQQISQNTFYKISPFIPSSFSSLASLS